VRHGVEAHLDEPLLEVRVPEVLDLVVRPARQVRRDRRPLVAEDGVEVQDGLFFLLRELAPLDVRPQVVGPPQPAALAASVQPCKSSQA